ncbi:hypothetical protein K438DRAFT_1990743 [Mycena galopus ATCC 62051]|nr:hypothetical protein K438DRAFT_1990743 [Mycena galopus ATCC 62051]
MRRAARLDNRSSVNDREERAGDLETADLTQPHQLFCSTHHSARRPLVRVSFSDSFRPAGGHAVCTARVLHFCFESSRRAGGACSLSLPSRRAELNWMRAPIPFEYNVRLLGLARTDGILVNLDLHTAPGSQNGEWCGVALSSLSSFPLLWLSAAGEDWLAHGRESPDAKRRGAQGGGGAWTGVWSRSGAWTSAAARERHWPFTPPLEAASWELHAAFVCSAGRNLARHYPLTRVLSFPQISLLASLLASPSSRPVYPHFPQAITNFLNGVMGDANTHRMLDDIRVIVEFISQPEYKNLRPMFGVVNEGPCLLQARDSNTYPLLTAYFPGIGRTSPSPFLPPWHCTDTATQLPLPHEMMRSITGCSAGTGPIVSIHDGFLGIAS